jgi:hypothetical protein
LGLKGKEGKRKNGEQEIDVEDWENVMFALMYYVYIIVIPYIYRVSCVMITLWSSPEGAAGL